MTLTLDTDQLPKRMLRTLLVAELLLVILDYVFNYRGLIRVDGIRNMFNIAREDSFGTLFSSSQAIAVGFVLGLISATVRKNSGERKSLPWGIFALFFIYLGIDDFVQIHERVSSLFNTIYKSANGEVMSGRSIFGFPSYSWHVVFGPFFGAMGLFMFFFLWREFKDEDLRRLLLGALGCYALAVGMDLVEGLPSDWDEVGRMIGMGVKPARHFSKVLEETLENLGTTLFLICFSKYLFKTCREISVQFR